MSDLDLPAAAAEEPAEGTTTVTVKAMRLDTWERARAAARAQGQSMGVWVARAVNQLADREAGERLIFPDELREQRDGLTAVYPAGTLAPVVNTSALDEMMRTAAATAAASGVPVPSTMAKHYYAVGTSALRAARGLEPLKPRPTTRAGRLVPRAPAIRAAE